MGRGTENSTCLLFAVVLTGVVSASKGVLYSTPRFYGFPAIHAKQKAAKVEVFFLKGWVRGGQIYENGYC